MQTSDTLVVEPKPVKLDPAEVARMILAGFDRHYALFRYGAQRAKSLYESGDWIGIQKLSRERIEYYDRRVRECLAKLNPVLAKQAGSQDPVMSPEQQQFWQAVRQTFVSLLSDHQQPECAETFYNSVTCRALHRDYFHNDFFICQTSCSYRLSR